MNITSSNDCGGFKAPKGHLDTQMYPECEGKDTDRNIVKKTVEKRKKKKSFNLKEYKTAERRNTYLDEQGSFLMQGPDLDKLDISKLQLIKEWLMKKFPKTTWTIETTKEWLNDNFIGKPKPFVFNKNKNPQF